MDKELVDEIELTMAIFNQDMVQAVKSGERQASIKGTDEPNQYETITAALIPKYREEGWEVKLEYANDWNLIHTTLKRYRKAHMMQGDNSPEIEARNEKINEALIQSDYLAVFEHLGYLVKTLIEQIQSRA